MLYGIDTSVYQGRVDWHQVKRDGYSFGVPKATEGLGFLDPTFPASWEQLASEGLVRIAYHFFHDRMDGGEQSDYLHEYVHNNGHFRWGDMLALDVEEVGVTDAILAFSEITAFITRSWKQIAKPVLIYTNVDTWVNLLGNPTNAFIEQCPLWLADLGAYGQLPAPWPTGPAFEQWSWHGTVPGVAGQVDLDRFRGNRQQLDRIRYTVPHVS